MYRRENGRGWCLASASLSEEPPRTLCSRSVTIVRTRGAGRQLLQDRQRAVQRQPGLEQRGQQLGEGEQVALADARAAAAGRTRPARSPWAATWIGK